MQFEKQKQIAMSLLCVVCDREKGPKVVATLEGQKSLFNMATLGRGTASTKMLGYLGIGESEKAIFFCVMPTDIATGVVQILDTKLELQKPGKGIAFLARIYEGCYHQPVLFTGPEKEGVAKDMEATHDLIMVILNRGYTEEVMDAARAAGARGGTVLHARGCGLSGAEKFFGVTIQPEKEMLMIVAESPASCEIMGTIAEQAGPGSDANAISFSMPLGTVCGIAEAAPPK